MPRYRAFLGNLLMLGETMSPVPTGSRRDRTVFNFGRYSMLLVRTGDTFAIPPHQLVETTRHTHDLTIENVETGQRGAVRQKVIELCELLSFLTGSQVAFLGDQFLSSHFAPGSKDVALSYHPLLSDPREIRRAAEQIHRRFHAIRARRRLNEVLHMLRLPGKPGTPWEVRLLLVFVALESLKSSYAKSVGYKFSAPSWRKVVLPGVALSGQPKIGFEKLLKEMLAAVKMRSGLGEVVTLRNHIIHNGVSSMRRRTQERIYSKAQDILRNYVLRLVGYVGEYSGYAPGVTKKLTKVYPV